MEERQGYLKRLILAMGFSFLLLAVYVIFFPPEAGISGSVNATASNSSAVEVSSSEKEFSGRVVQKKASLAQEGTILANLTGKDFKVLKVGSAEYVVSSTGRAIKQVYVTDRTGKKPLFEPPAVYISTGAKFSISRTPRHKDYGGGQALRVSFDDGSSSGSSSRKIEIMIRGYFSKEVLSSYRDSEKLVTYQQWKKKSYNKPRKKTIQGTLAVKENSPVWIALTSRYYVFAIAFAPSDLIVKNSVKPNLKLVSEKVSFLWDGQILRLSMPSGVRFYVYSGLRDPALLKKFGLMLEKSSSLGMFAKFFARILRTFHSFVGDWGLAIILLAIFIKIILWPLTHSSLVSAKKMKELQPKMEELKKKYSDNPQKFQQEVTRLYREVGVSPASGCLPMLLQIPIFVALYNALRGAIELKGASTFLMPWVPDLSESDPLHIMPILMGVSMILQQWASGQFRDSNTRLTSIIMSVVFVYLFWKFPSGLVFYWFVFNILSLLHQLYIDKTWESKKAKASKRPVKKA